MRWKRLIVAWSFVLSLALGTWHEVEHQHTWDETCEISLLAHVPAVLMADPSIVLTPMCVLSLAEAPQILYIATLIKGYRAHAPPSYASFS